MHTTDPNLSEDEKRFVEQYLRLMDMTTRIAESVQSANGEWSYVSEKLEIAADATRRLNELMTEQIPNPDDPERPYRGMVASFDRREANASRPHTGGPTAPVPEGFVDPGKVRAAVAALGWPHELVRAAHPIEQIEDRFAQLRGSALAERDAYLRPGS